MLIRVVQKFQAVSAGISIYKKTMTGRRISINLF